MYIKCEIMRYKFMVMILNRLLKQKVFIAIKNTNPETTAQN